MAAFRYAATRSLRTLSTTATISTSPLQQQLRSRLCTLSRQQGVLLAKPAAPKTTALVRWASNVNKVDEHHESELAKQKLEAHPELVSSTSSTHPLRSEIGAGPGQRGQHEDEAEMLSGVKSDLKTIRDTFSLESVPRQAYYVGMAGVIPYMATSVATVACAYEISHGGIFMSEKTAELALHLIEPIQIGYGAVIISFLGAIHWGLEFAGYGGYHGYNRYAIGVVSTACAWPTLLLPAEYALITQFLVFNFLYYTDSRACKRGWTPAWYDVYRFVLTFIVGGAIVVSLIGRGQIADRIGALPGVSDRVKALRDSQYVPLEEEEEARRKFLAEKDEEDEEEEGGDDEE